MTVTLTTVSSIFFNQQNTFGKVIDHVNNNPTKYQSYGPQSGLEKKKINGKYSHASTNCYESQRLLDY